MDNKIRFTVRLTQEVYAILLRVNSRDVLTSNKKISINQTITNIIKEKENDNKNKK